MKKIKINLIRPILTFIFNSMSVVGLSQDTIELNNKIKIPGKVLEISSVEIKYKKYDNVDGPDYIIDKEDVSVIKYKNGTVDSFPVVKPWLRPAKEIRKEIVTDSSTQNTSLQKVDFDGNRYYFKNDVLSEHKLQNILKEKNNVDINRFVRKARLSKTFENVSIIGFPAVMIGLGFLIESQMSGEGINENYSNDNKNYGIALIAFSGACLSTSIYLNWNKKKQNRNAIKLYNQLY